MHLRRLLFWCFVAPWLASCQCGQPATVPLPWKGPGCFSPPPFCASKLLCQNGLWECIKCLDGESKTCYEGNPKTLDVGTCKQGVQKCILGTWSICTEQVLPNNKDACGDQRDDNCDGQIDEGCVCDPNKPPRVCGQTIGICVSGTQSCGPDGKWQACLGEIKPQPEICDGIDNDCDGQVDEDFQRVALGPLGLREPCEAGVGACKSAGKYVCGPQKINTVCDAPLLQPTVEDCDGKDNDCDGKIDNGFDDKGKTCNNGQKGICYAEGKMICKSDGSGLVCNAPSPTKKAEICDGKDNDCNGQTDEDFPEKNDPCTDSNLKGECAKGRKECKGGKIQCTTTTAPSPELCNNKDDDCDGQVDEDNPEGGADCTIPNTNGPCKDGVLSCISGKLDCKPKTPSQAETCNNIDDNCDGKIDEGLTRKCNSGCGDEICKAGNWETDNCKQDGDSQSCNFSQDGCNQGKQKCGRNNQWGACEADCCQDKEKRDCYFGPSGTKNTGECKDGKQECKNGIWERKCVGDVRPVTEICKDGLDNDCDGKTDEGCN